MKFMQIFVAFGKYKYDPFIFAIGEAGPFLLHLILKFRKAIGSASWPTVETAGLVTWLAGLVIFFSISQSCV